MEYLDFGMWIADCGFGMHGMFDTSIRNLKSTINFAPILQIKFWA